MELTTAMRFLPGTRVTQQSTGDHSLLRLNVGNAIGPVRFKPLITSRGILTSFSVIGRNFGVVLEGSNVTIHKI